MKIDREMAAAIKLSALNKMDEHECEIVGIRFETLNREIGDVCQNSRHNPNRDDEREFPEYGTQEYSELEELEGTSAWELRVDITGSYFSDMHCYIIGGDIGYHPEPDQGEILIENAIVLEKIF